MSSKATVCPACGAQVDEDSRSFEEKLIFALKHPLPETRARICWILGHKKTSAAVPALLEVLNDNDLFVRVAAIVALGEIGDEAALKDLLRLASDDNKLLRNEAQTAVDKIRKTVPQQETGNDSRLV
jgi:HEAT repeat protein